MEVQKEQLMYRLLDVLEGNNLVLIQRTTIIGA